MGYYSYWRLVVDDLHKPLIKEFRKECADASEAFDDEGSNTEGCKWYEAESDLRAFSKKHPTVLFTLYGDGEDDEKWVHYAKYGKMQTENAEVTYADFDENKLE